MKLLIFVLTFFSLLNPAGADVLRCKENSIGYGKEDLTEIAKASFEEITYKNFEDLDEAFKVTSEAGVVYYARKDCSVVSEITKVQNAKNVDESPVQEQKPLNRPKWNFGFSVSETKMVAKAFASYKSEGVSGQTLQMDLIYSLPLRGRNEFDFGFYLSQEKLTGDILNLSGNKTDVLMMENASFGLEGNWHAPLFYKTSLYLGSSLQYLISSKFTYESDGSEIETDAKFFVLINIGLKYRIKIAKNQYIKPQLGYQLYINRSPKTENTVLGIFYNFDF